MEDHKISVIVPVYNMEQYLDECISSIVNQTYRNIEIILVDDGSTDHSGYICETWCAKDERITVIHKENGGISSARNAGLEKATGEFISFIDSDDYVDLHMLEVGLNNILQGFDMVSFGYWLTYEDKTSQNIRFCERDFLLRNDDERRNFVIGPFFKYEFGWVVWSQLFRTEIIKRYSIAFEDTKTVLSEDQLFLLFYLSHCLKIRILGESLYFYRQRKNSFMDFSRKIFENKFAQKNNSAGILYRYYIRWDHCQAYIDVFPIIHYLLIEREIQMLERAKEKYSGKAVRHFVIQDITEKSDLQFFEEDFKRVHACKHWLNANYSRAKRCSILIRARGMMKNSILYSIMVKLYRLINKWHR